MQRFGEETYNHTLPRAIARGEAMFETPNGPITQEALDWVYEQESEYISPTDEKDVAAGLCIRAGPPPPGVERRYFPRLPRKQYLDSQLEHAPEAPGKLLALVSGMRYMSPQAKKYFLRYRRAVVRQDGPHHQTVMIVPKYLTPRPVGKPLECPDLGPVHKAYMDELDTDISARKYKRTYLLEDIFDNPEIAATYNASPKAIRTLKLVSSADVRSAAAIVQDSLNIYQNHTTVEVLLEYPAKDRIKAASTIRRVARNYRSQSSSIESAVVDDTLFIFGPAGEADWHVRGPLEHSETLLSLHCMISAETVTSVAMMFAMEMSSLGLHVSDGLLNTQEPLVHLHKGNGTKTISRLSNESSDLSIVRSIDSETGVHVGSAVQISTEYALVNTHIVEATEVLNIADKRVFPETDLHPDLTMLKCDIGEEVEEISRRTAEVGEAVRIHYAISGKVYVTDKVEVRRVSGYRIHLSRNIRTVPGMSGGAIVAVSDGALLALHCGITGNGNPFAVSVMNPRLDSLLSKSSSGPSSAVSETSSPAYSVKFSFKSTGRLNIFEALTSSVIPIFDGDEVRANAVCSGGHWYTSNELLGTPITRDKVSATNAVQLGNLKRFNVPELACCGSPIFTRPANDTEAIYIMTWLGDELMISKQVRVLAITEAGFLTNTLVGDNGILIGSCAFSSDGAALGLLVRRFRSSIVGIAYEFANYPAFDVLEESSNPNSHQDFSGLGERFPWLSIARWPQHVVEEIVTHTSCGSYSTDRPFNAGPRPLANVGDDIAKWFLYRVLYEAKIPHKDWSAELQRRQSNLSMSAICWSVGLANHIKVGKGTNLPADSKAFADMLEAFIGAVSILENKDALRRTLIKCRMIPE